MRKADFIKFLVNKNKNILKWHPTFWGPFNDIFNQEEIVKGYMDSGYIERSKPEIALKSLAASELKSILEKHNLPQQGTKEKLIARIVTSVPEIKQENIYPYTLSFTPAGDAFYKEYFKQLSEIVMDLFYLLSSEEYEKARQEAREFTSGVIQQRENPYALSSESYSQEWKDSVLAFINDPEAPATLDEKRIYLLYMWLPSRFVEPINKFADTMQIPHENSYWNQQYIKSLLEIKRIRDTKHEYYIIHTAHDCRVCEQCRKADNVIFSMSELKIGVNFTPLHKDCRCYVAPIILWREVEWPHLVFVNGSIIEMTKGEFADRFHAEKLDYWE